KSENISQGKRTSASNFFLLSPFLIFRREQRQEKNRAQTLFLARPSAGSWPGGFGVVRTFLRRIVAFSAGRATGPGFSQPTGVRSRRECKVAQTESCNVPHRER